MASVKVNGRKLPVGTSDSVTLPYEALPEKAKVEIVMEGGWPAGQTVAPASEPSPTPPKIEFRWLKQKNGSSLPVSPYAIGLPPSMRDAYAGLLRRQSSARTDFDKALISAAFQAFEAYRVRAATKTDMTPEKRAAVLKMYEAAAMDLCEGYVSLEDRHTAPP